MKVLEQGPGWSIKKKCTGRGNGGGGCESTLLIEKEDVYVTAHSDYAGDTDYFYTFRCPVCGCETDIEEKDVPRSIQREELERYKRIRKNLRYSL